MIEIVLCSAVNTKEPKQCSRLCLYLPEASFVNSVVNRWYFCSTGETKVSIGNFKREILKFPWLHRSVIFNVLWVKQVLFWNAQGNGWLSNSFQVRY